VQIVESNHGPCPGSGAKVKNVQQPVAVSLKPIEPLIRFSNVLPNNSFAVDAMKIVDPD
jgi:hypothetical protein